MNCDQSIHDTGNKENVFCHNILTQQEGTIYSEKYSNLRCSSEDEYDDDLFSNQQMITKNWIQQEQIPSESLQNQIMADKFSQLAQLSSTEFIKDMVQEQLKNEKTYKVSLDYMTRHKDLKPSMRAMLFDWMKEVCTAFNMKRETLYLACHYLESYLDLTIDVPRSKLQLLGITSLFISQKIEEIAPQRVSDFSQTTDNLYTSAEICDTEIELMLKLQFRLTPPTYMFWLNLYCKLWDDYISVINLNDWLSSVYLKKNTQQGYQLFSELCQILDCVLVDPNSLQYNKRLIILSLMYLIVGKTLECFSIDNIVNEMIQGANFVTNIQIELNQLFLHFIQNEKIYFEQDQIISLEDLPLYVQYLAQFFIIPISYDLPQCFQQNPELLSQTHYEDFLNFQTHNQNTLKVIEHLAKKGL